MVSCKTLHPNLIPYWMTGRPISTCKVAFQPILDFRTKEVLSYEVLARGDNGESPRTLFANRSQAERDEMELMCRTRAMELSQQIGITSCLNLNIEPTDIDDAISGIEPTLRAAEEIGFPVERLILEFTETSRVENWTSMCAFIRELQQMGFRTAIDDLGSGYAGLSLLPELKPDFVKLDMSLIRDIDSDRYRRVIVDGIATSCRNLSILVIAEGVETRPELNALLDLGIRYFQGYLFAKPALEALPEIHWPVGEELSSGDSGTKFGSDTVFK